MKSDPDSVVADPGFADVAGLDFSLADDSPARSLGFEPIELEKIGRLHDPAIARLRTSGALKRGAGQDID